MCTLGMFQSDLHLQVLRVLLLLYAVCRLQMQIEFDDFSNENCQLPTPYTNRQISIQVPHAQQSYHGNNIQPDREAEKFNKII